MSFANRYIETAEKIIISYDGSLPLQHYLKQFFAADKKYGSKDRKAISHACYCYFRLGQLRTDSIHSRIKLGIFLCTDERGIWSKVFDERWIANWSSDLKVRLQFAADSLKAEEIFPLDDELSTQLNKEAFVLSHLVQPDFHIRIRPGKKDKVIRQLSEANLSFTQFGENSLALPNGSKIDEVINLNKDAVVQDLSSQRIEGVLSTIKSDLPTLSVWDCCAASGGKSILAVDHFKNVELTVSDVRPSIIQNLKKRFAEAGIKNYSASVIDLTKSLLAIHHSPFNLIICDAPCSGSGTWSRTPEQLTFFKKEKISYYTDLQRKIVSKVIPSISENGYLLYITCSVFKKENEDVVEFILANSNLQLVKMEYMVGYDKKADTMFAALFTVSTP